MKVTRRSGKRLTHVNTIPYLHILAAFISAVLRNRTPAGEATCRTLGVAWSHITKSLLQYNKRTAKKTFSWGIEVSPQTKHNYVLSCYLKTLYQLRRLKTSDATREFQRHKKKLRLFNDDESIAEVL
jgi:hypothetical protein